MCLFILIEKFSFWNLILEIQFNKFKLRNFKRMTFFRGFFWYNLYSGENMNPALETSFFYSVANHRWNLRIARSAIDRSRARIALDLRRGLSKEPVAALITGRASLVLVMTKSTCSIIIAECMALSCRGPGLGCRPLPRVTDRLFYAVHGVVTSSRRVCMPAITGGWGRSRGRRAFSTGVIHLSISMSI